VQQEICAWRIRHENLISRNPAARILLMVSISMRPRTGEISQMAQSPSPAMFAATDSYAEHSAHTLALVARLLIGWLFLDYGWMKLLGHDGTVRYLANLHVPMPELMYWPVMLAELGIGIALILGIATRYVSLFTFVYLIIATAIAHRYWEVPPAAVGAQYANFCKNLAIMGGALLLYVLGAGRFSLDARLRRR
jgi:putative oxidoreductase